MIPNGNILYVAPHGLGDLIMSLPAIELILDNGYRLTVLVKSNSERQYLEHTTNHQQFEILVLDEYRNLGLLSGMTRLFWKLLSSRFIAAIPQMNLNEKLFNLLLVLTFVKRRRLSVALLEEALGNRPSIRDRHKVEINFELASKIIDSYPSNKTLTRWKSSPPRSKSVPKIAIAPGSGEIESHKRWPAIHYVNLIKELTSLFPNVVIKIFGASNEAKMCRDIESQSNGMASFAVLGSVAELYDALKDFDICIANCNGASHVAAHAGTMVVGIYGPTQAAFTGAYCDSMFEVNLKLECSPCYRKGYTTGCGDPVCLTGLEVGLVIDAVKQILD